MDSRTFLSIEKHDFERYYPEEFQVQVDDVLNIKVKEDKMRAKVLLEKVKNGVWKIQIQPKKVLGNLLMR